MIKKIAIFFFILFILVAGLYAVVQSTIGQNLVRKVITRSLKENGLEIQIEKITGTLPHQINLKEVTIIGKEFHVSIQELQLRPILWRLLKRELAFETVHGKKIVIDDAAPFDFDGTFRINSRRAYLKGNIADWQFTARLNRKTKRSTFRVQNGDLLYAKGKALLDKNNDLLSSDIEMRSDQALSHLPFPASGQILAHIHITPVENGYAGQISWHIPDLIVEKQKMGDLLGEGNVTWIHRALQGTFSIEPYTKVTIDWQVATGKGVSFIEIENLQSLHVPNVYGKLAAKMDWTPQSTVIDATATDFYYKNYFAQKVNVTSNLEEIEITLEKGKWHDLELDTAHFKINQEFTLTAVGKWQKPLALEMRGNTTEIKSLTGTFYNRPFILLKPIALNGDHTAIELTIGNALISAQLEKNKTHLKLEQFPLDLLSLHPLEVPISGKINLEAEAEEKNGNVQGNVTASFVQAEPLPILGQFEGQLNHDLLDIKGKISMQEKSLLDVNAQIPIYLSIHPFLAKLELHKTAKGQITWDTRVETFLDFFDLGPHRFEGRCVGDLQLNNTLYDPLIQGTIQFQDGSYENYYTGTSFNHIEADILAENDRLVLKSLKTQDDALLADGEIRLLSGELYPFHINATLNNLKFAEIDLVTATANGNLHIEGNTSSAIAQGEVQILKSDLSIPDHIPNPPPDLPVTYRNPIHSVPPPQMEYHPYPLFLDLHVTAPQAISITGRGLQSEWTGNFHLGGTYTSIAAKGQLQLVNGEFNFAGRSFKLTDGSLLFSGVEHEMPSIRLDATTETKGVTITAHLNGPLNNPQITFQSSPPLPLGSIMSYLLFGQDLAEISGFQALQIATSIASLAGTGPDIMESTRKALGVDRIRIVSSTTEEGAETVALQVGKYISEGFLVTLTQGAEDSSTNVSVEIELKNNFVFQIQSDQRQEQGIFTIKWNLNY